MLIQTCRKGIRFAKRMRKGHLGSMAFKGDKGEQNGALRIYDWKLGGHRSLYMNG